MIAALGFLAAALSISVVWPQVWRSCRHRRTFGLSPTTAWLAVALNFSWLTFGLLIGDTAQILANAVVGAANTAVLIALLVTQPHLRRSGMLARTATGAVALVAVAAGSSVSVVVLHADRVVVAAVLSAVVSVTGAVAALPQPLSMLRDRTQDLSGLSVARWRLGAGSAASWTGYGWLIGEPAVSLSAAVGLSCALLTCALLRASRTATATATPTATATGGRTRVRPALPAIPGCRVPARPVLVAA